MGGRGSSSARNSSPSTEEYIAEWKSNEVKAIVGELERYRAKVKEWEKTQSFMDRTALERTNIPSVYLQIVKRNFKDDESKNRVFNKMATELVDSHFEALRDKVEKNIGPITKIVRTGGPNDYVITGESGESVSIQVVMAGGYNKQRLHTRWVQNKLGSRRKK